MERPRALACGRGKWKKELLLLGVGEGEGEVGRAGEGGMVESTHWISARRAR